MLQRFNPLNANPALKRFIDPAPGRIAQHLGGLIQQLAPVIDVAPLLALSLVPGDAVAGNDAAPGDAAPCNDA